MKIAKASDDDIRRVREFFQMLEEIEQYGTYTPSADAAEIQVGDETFRKLIVDQWGVREGVRTSWSRVLFGFEVLLDNCCDPNLDYLDWKPEFKELHESAQTVLDAHDQNEWDRLRAALAVLQPSESGEDE